MSFMEQVKNLQIPLRDILLATKSFDDENYIGRGGFGRVYRGVLLKSQLLSVVAIKRLDNTSGQGEREFMMEIAMLSSYRHENLVSLVGFCDEGGEKILVYEYASNGSLDKLLHNKNFTWMQRLKVCLDAARGLKYLHHDAGAEHRVIHRDIKSSNILLDENWKAKISDFGLSKIGPANIQFTFLFSNVCGTIGYVDPQYIKTGILTKESDVFSFGVVLFEVLCGRPACIDCNHESRFLFKWAQQHYEKKTLDLIINTNLRDQMNSASLSMFSTIAHQCVRKRREERPTMSVVVEQLQKALDSQEKYEDILYGRGNRQDNEMPTDECSEDIYLSSSLESYLGKKLLVWLRDGRKLFGTLRSSDQFGHAVLEGVYERVIVGELYCDIMLGLFVIRGENIVLIGEMYLENEELPSYMTRVSVNEIKRAQQEEREAKNLMGSTSMRKKMEFLVMD